MADQFIEGGVQIKVDTQQANGPAVFTIDNDGSGAQRFAAAVAGKIGNMAFPILLLDGAKHIQGQISNGRTLVTICIVPIGDGNDRVLHGLQAVQHDLISYAQIILQTAHQIPVRVQDQPLRGSQHDFCLFHNIFLS